MSCALVNCNHAIIGNLELIIFIAKFKRNSLEAVKEHAISELMPQASFSKRVLVPIMSYEMVFIHKQIKHISI